MSRAIILEWLEKRYPHKYTAPEIIKYTGLGSWQVYGSLKKLRKNNEVCCDVLVTSGKNYDRHTHHYSAIIEECVQETKNLNRLKLSSGVEIKENDVNYYFSAEELFDKVYVGVQKSRDYVEGFSLRPSFDNYPRKDVLLAKWDKIKQEVNK
jgi:hypothetical protein